MKYLSVILTILGLCAFASDGASSHDNIFHIYIESWDRISLGAAKADEGKVLRWHSKQQATRLIAYNLATLQPTAEVLLGKNLFSSAKGIETEIDEIQNWLVSNGITEITFKQTIADNSPYVVRIFKDGKAIKPQQTGHFSKSD